MTSRPLTPGQEGSGAELDGFHLGPCIHSGAMGRIFRVTGPDRGFAMIMKVPRVGPGEDSEGLISFEIESMILPALSGAHVPRFVAGGSLAKTPYLVVEWIEGESLEHVLKRRPLSADEVASMGAAVADALHSLHLQDTVHLDLKPENLIVRNNGEVVLIDFGLAYHAHFPDLLAEEQRFAAGSAPYVSPEQVLGTRSDPRSDIFALGVVLYELATGELPFGSPATMAGLRDRLWRDPVPPSVRSPELPPWLQEIILRCLEPDAEDRYQSAAHVAFDLRNPDQVALTERARKASQAGVLEQARRWWRARGDHPAPSRLPGFDQLVGGDTHDVNAAVRVRGHARRDRSPPCQPELRGVRCAQDNQIDVIASREFQQGILGVRGLDHVQREPPCGELKRFDPVAQLHEVLEVGARRAFAVAGVLRNQRTANDRHADQAEFG